MLIALQITNINFYDDKFSIKLMKVLVNTIFKFKLFRIRFF